MYANTHHKYTCTFHTCIIYLTIHSLKLENDLNQPKIKMSKLTQSVKVINTHSFKFALTTPKRADNSS